MVDSTIKNEFAVLMNHCQRCGVDFVIGVIDGDWLKEEVVFCPYCGATIKPPVALTPRRKPLDPGTHTLHKPIAFVKIRYTMKL